MDSHTVLWLSLWNDSVQIRWSRINKMIDGQSELAGLSFPDQNPTLADSDQVKLILCIVFHRTD